MVISNLASYFQGKSCFLLRERIISFLVLLNSRPARPNTVYVGMVLFQQ